MGTVTPFQARMALNDLAQRAREHEASDSEAYYNSRSKHQSVALGAWSFLAALGLLVFAAAVEIGEIIFGMIARAAGI